MLHAESEPKVYKFGRVFCGVSAHVLSAVFTVLVTVLSRPGSSLFSWHPFLMTLAFSFLMTEAILLFSPHSSPASKCKHQTKSRLHLVLQCLSLSCAVLAFGAIFYNKHLHAKPHFVSCHGLVGLLAFCAVVLQSLGGLPLFYHKLARGWSLAKLKRYHAASGLVTYLLGSVSLLLGTCSVWFTASVRGHAWYLAAFCPILGALVVMSQVTGAYTTKKRLQS